MTEAHEFRRRILQRAEPARDTNAGVWLDKYLQSDSDEAKKDLVKAITQIIEIPKAYKEFYDNWVKLLNRQGVVVKKAKTLTRLAVNLGAESVLENSIALSRTYGVPYIPGSALKGLASHYAINSLGDDWDENALAYRTLFGVQEEAGYVNFFDALYVPENGRGLVPDVVTVHHQDYYQKGTTPPADWDSPIPIHFLSVSGSFLIALSGPNEWVKAAFEILELALDREGIGAKTSSGYGRMRFEQTEMPAHTEVQSTAPGVQEIPAGYQRGVVKKFMDTYGFIQPDGGGPDIFVHIKSLAAGLKELKARQVVVFKVGPGKRPGDIQAIDVRIVS